MSSSRATVTPEIVRNIAGLARLQVPETELALWAQQLSRIVSYIDQIAEIPESAFGPSPAASATPVREDEPRPGAGLEALQTNAPRSLHGYGVVPRVVASGQ